MSAGTRQNNGGWGGEYGRHVPFEEFDRLPWPLRQVYCFAAYNYTPANGIEGLQKGVPLDELVARLKANMRRRMRSEVLRLYGPDHPQAAR